MLRVAWLPRVNRKERAEYEAAAITDGVSGYRIKSLKADGAFATAPQNDEYYPVFFSTQPKTSTVYGMDYATVPERRAALERARDNDRVATLRTRLYEPKKGGRPLGVLVAIPVYAKGTSRDTVADRRRNLAGFVVGVFDLPPADPVDPNDDGRKSGRQHQRLSAKCGPRRAGGMRADFSSEQRQPQSMRALVTVPHWSGALKIGDTNWQVRAMPTAGGPLNAHYYRALAVLAAGIVITAVLAAYLCSQAAIRSGSPWRTGGCWNSPRPTS